MTTRSMIALGHQGFVRVPISRGSPSPTLEEHQWAIPPLDSALDPRLLRPRMRVDALVISTGALSFGFGWLKPKITLLPMSVSMHRHAAQTVSLNVQYAATTS
ncbi:hypothetical protein E6O75_ATG10114 [Venturia nashicola]|uniref:Uncharacterized protein n=1 Tax=Venturia nashicola TaxID=86259 RepID=A0A4Z1NC95_9PEZI|nr:hypothetical protein E6O75_ATG10114 [Venturia nashicola]